MIWFVYALPLPILVAILTQLLPFDLRHRVQGYALAASLALAAGLIALPPSASWSVKARYHLLSDVPVYARLAVDGLTGVAAVAILLTTAWDALVRQVDHTSLSGIVTLVVTATLGVFMSANGLTLLLTWSGFGLLRVVLAANDPKARSRPVIAGELASLATLLAALQPLGLVGLSTPLFAENAPAMTGWLVVVSCALRMGIYPLQADGAHRNYVRLGSALTGLYLLLRTSPAEPAVVLALVLLATGASARAFRAEGLRDDWQWLLQHALLVGALAATLGPAGSQPGLAMLVCVSICQPTLHRLQGDRWDLYDLLPLLALGGMVPTLGWAAWTGLLEATSLLGPRWLPLLLGCSYALCAWVLGHGLRLRWPGREIRWRELLRWQDAWRSLPALALLLLGIRPRLLASCGQAPPWVALQLATEQMAAGTSWPIALGVAALAAASAALGSLRPLEVATPGTKPRRNNNTQALRTILDSIERIRETIADIDITLRNHATLAWTTLAATALLLWLRGR